MRHFCGNQWLRMVPVLAMGCGWWHFTAHAQETEAMEKNEEYLEFNYGQDTGGDEWTQSIRVKTPVRMIVAMPSQSQADKTKGVREDEEN